MKTELDSDLSFIFETPTSLAERGRKAPWLLSEFENPQWRVNLGTDQDQEVNWAIELPDDSKLTDKKNFDLLQGLKYFLTLSTLIDTNGLPNANCEAWTKRAFSTATH